MNSPLVTIIIPTFNAATTISKAIDSIVSQSIFEKIECLVMDGKSTDNTNVIVKSYPFKNIIHFSEPDNGIYDAMNRGILKGKG